MKFIINIILLTFLCLVASKKDKSDDNNVNVALSFSLPSGFYNKESIQLEIKSSNPEAIIYYTVDGHNPTENSTVYEKALTLKNKSEEDNVYCMIEEVSVDFRYPAKKVNKANIIRAIAKLPDGTFSNIISGSYFVGLDKKKLYGNLPVVSLITDPDNLFGHENGIYVLGKTYDDWLEKDPSNIDAPNYQVVGNYNNKGKDYERPGTFEYIPAGKDIAEVNQDLRIRIKGKATRTTVQKSLRLINRAEYGKKNLKYEIIPGNQRSDGKGPVTKYKTFVLRNGGNDGKYAKIRDNLLQGLITNDFFETQQNDMAIVYIDGEYWGIYYIYEEYEGHYIANNYDIDDKNVAVIKSAKNIEAGSEKDLEDYKADMKYISDNDMTVPANYEKASSLLDIEGYAWASAFYAYINTKDGWFRGGNYNMWRVIEPMNNVTKADGKWRLMMYDTEYSTGMYVEGSDYDENVLQDIYNSTSKNYSRLTSVVAKSLTENEEFKTMFVNALCDMRNVNFETNKVNQRIEDLRTTIIPLLQESYDRFQEFEIPKEMGPIAYFNNEVDILKTWLNKRHAVFMNHIKEHFKFKPAVKVTITANSFKKGSILLNNFNTLTKEYTGEYFSENILYITGKPFAGRKLKSWKLKKCKLANKNKNTIGVYPKKGCTVTATFA